MFRYQVLLFLIFLSVSGFAQPDLCSDQTAGFFWPVESGSKIKYASRGQSYTAYFPGETLVVDGQTYLKQVVTYANGNVRVSYYRRAGNAVYFYDTERKAVSMELIDRLVPGVTWEKFDKSWKYTIIDTVSTFTTPSCTFTNLLQVKAEPQNELQQAKYTWYNLFYKRGVGLVGMKVNGEPYLFAEPEATSKDRSFMAYGCESQSSAQAIQRCSYGKIMAYIQAELRITRDENYKAGKIIANVIFGTTGLVENVTIVETIDGATAQEKEVIRVLKALPNVIPALAGDGKPIRSSVRIPISF